MYMWAKESSNKLANYNPKFIIFCADTFETEKFTIAKLVNS
jgi:hypothetical protein